MIRRYFLYIAILVMTLLIAVSINQPNLKAEGVPFPDRYDEDRTASIKFSHKFHISDVGVDCASCHAVSEKKGPSLRNRPTGHNACNSCHEEQVSQTCDYCHVDPKNIQPIPPIQHDVHWYHEKHVGMKGMECLTCHVDVDKVDRVTSANMPKMLTCATCHSHRQVSTTCGTCHSNFVVLLPEDHKRSDFTRNHRELVRLGDLQGDCQTCHTETYCQQCHQIPGLKAFGKKDRIADPAPSTSIKDSPKELLLQNVHEFNHRFTHGIDAKARQAECSTCHSSREFCSKCHQEGGNITRIKFKPASHLAPGFAMIGIGSGGGLHAEEARRDIESCMSCHDVEGRDPTCVTCHADGKR